jgi:hypothetical protein
MGANQDRLRGEKRDAARVATFASWINANDNEEPMLFAHRDGEWFHLKAA